MPLHSQLPPIAADIIIVIVVVVFIHPIFYSSLKIIILHHWLSLAVAQ